MTVVCVGRIFNYRRFSIAKRFSDDGAILVLWFLADDCCFEDERAQVEMESEEKVNVNSHFQNIACFFTELNFVQNSSLQWNLRPRAPRFWKLIKLIFLHHTCFTIWTVLGESILNLLLSFLQVSPLVLNNIGFAIILSFAHRLRQFWAICTPKISASDRCEIHDYCETI